MELMTPTIAILADDSAEGARLCGMLQREGLRARCEVPNGPLDTEIIVVSGESAMTRLPGIGSGRDMGVVSIGDSSIGNTAAADVCLPADCAPRELALSCRLLGEIVRLRRQAVAVPVAAPADGDLSLIDELTKLPNRRAWQQELARRIDAAAAGQSLCLAIIDLDHFKQVNTGWGHTVGDRLLIATAAALRHGLRPGDFVARLGGDEFGLLLSGLEADSAGGVIDRVRRGVPALAARTAAHVVSCSAGYCLLPADGRSTGEALLAAADAALRRAKQAGRDVAMTAEST